MPNLEIKNLDLPEMARPGIPLEEPHKRDVPEVSDPTKVPTPVTVPDPIKSPREPVPVGH